MASSSTSSYIPKTSFKYDVFPSFRGEDTRTNFVDHLYHALKRENIETYKDDKNLEKGRRINKELIQAIEDSRFYVIVFSTNYASSSWCLDELVKIMECQNTETGHSVYPIFYHVEPTHVRKQSGEFGKAFSKHENDEDAEKWRKALVEAASISGHDLTVDKYKSNYSCDSSLTYRYEVEFIKKVVEEISSKLPPISADENLVGMRTRIDSVLSSLNASPDEFCMIGIWGIGGGGKTTLARAVFDQISFQFEGKSFVANVREASKPDFSGLNKLQQQVLRDVSNDQGIIINNVFDGKSMMKKKMLGRKVLVVLDDVDDMEQLKALAGEPNWFKPGSKIIITTRDKQVLQAHKVDSIHDVNLLTDEEATRLLSWCAFRTEIPSPGYKELLKRVVSYANGLPLTITILGLTLCGESEHVWEDTLKELEKIPLDGTLQRLELSYKGLDTNCQEIFLDVACILKGWEKEEAVRALKSCGFHAIRGLSVLGKKSLVTTKHGRLEMHDHIQEMGRHIVHRLHPNEPNKRSRLWIKEEIKHILANNHVSLKFICMLEKTNTFSFVTQAINCISLFVSSLEMDQKVVMKGLEKMEKLRLLLVYIDDIYSSWNLDKVQWSYFGKGERKVLDKLRFLNLSHSKLRSFDLGIAPNLEILSLENCNDLVELDMPCECPQLKSLNLSSSKLRSLSLGRTQNIETLNLRCIKGLVKLDMPRDYPQLKFLNLSCLDLRYFNLGLTPNIEAFSSFIINRIIVCNPRLKHEECEVEFDMSLECPQLESLELYLPNLRTLDLGPTPNLQILNLEGSYSLVELHMHDERCNGNVESLTPDENDDLVELFTPSKWPQLEYLTLIESKLRTFELTPNLKKLILKDCDLVEFHVRDGDVKLESLAIKRCSKLKILDLGRTPNLKSLCLEECSSLEEHAPVGGVKLLINLKGHLSTESVDIRTLQLDSSLPEFKFDCSYKEDLHSSIGNVEKLISEGLFCACIDIESFFGRICGLQHLSKLSLVGNISELPKDIDQLQCLEVEELPDELGHLECLEHLDIRGTCINNLPQSILLLEEQ
ncbi:hypothetical protein OSB04_015674, partial [Centaurea solstitialis]